MRTRFVTLAAVLALLTGWLGAAMPAAAAIEINSRIPFVNDEVDSCTGERVLVSGEQHVVGTMREDASGQQHFVFTRTTHGTGVGEESGAEYLLIIHFSKADLIGTTEGTATVFTQESQELLIRKGEIGSSDDNITHMQYRYTITPDGTFTAEIDVKNHACR